MNSGESASTVVSSPVETGDCAIIPRERSDDLLWLVSFVPARYPGGSLASREHAPRRSAGPARQLDQFHPHAAPAPAPICRQAVSDGTGNGRAGSTIGQTRQLGP